MRFFSYHGLSVGIGCSLLYGVIFLVQLGEQATVIYREYENLCLARTSYILMRRLYTLETRLYWFYSNK